MKRRVVITGLGAVTPIGNTVEEFWNGVRKGACGIGTITKFDTAEYKVHLAGEVKGFVAKERMDFKAARRMGTFSQYAVAAAKEAFADAGISMENEDPFRVGVLVGSGVGDLNACEQAKAKIDAGNPSRVNPFTVPVMIANMAAGNVAIALGAKGKCTSVVTACATGTHCIGDAFRAIQYNDADICVAGGAESAITPVGVAGFSALTALSESEDPLRASIPFDKDRNGFVMGEGAGILVLEELEHAKQRGAKIYAEVVGYGATCDAYHITSPLEDGSGAARAMELAMEEAGVKPEEVTYINAHGTSTHHNDLFETRAIRKAFGDAADHVLVNSTKSMVGHLLGAAGGVEAVVCAKSIQDGFVHQTIGTKEADAECDLNYCIGAPVETDVKLAMSNSLGFGGHNAVLLFQKYEYSGIVFRCRKENKMELDQILQLIDKVSDSSLTAFDYEADGIKIAMEHGKAAPVQVQMSGVPSGAGLQMAEMMGGANGVTAKEAAMPERKETAGKSTAAEDHSEAEEGVFVTSPLVGTFYTAPAEDAEPFVKVGDTVKKGQVVAIVEAMKLMNEIESEVDGVIAEVLVKNGEMVDYGKPLFRVKA